MLPSCNADHGKIQRCKIEKEEEELETKKNSLKHINKQ